MTRFTFFFFTLLIGILLIGLPAAWAQNYVPAADYNGPNVIVNMDTIGVNPFMDAPMPKLRPAPRIAPRGMPMAPTTPAYQSNANGQTTPLRLTPPSRQGIATTTPMAPSTINTPLTPVAPVMQVKKPTAPTVVSPPSFSMREMGGELSSAPRTTSDQSSARDLLASARSPAGTTIDKPTRSATTPDNNIVPAPYMNDDLTVPSGSDIAQPDLKDTPPTPVDDMIAMRQKIPPVTPKTSPQRLAPSTIRAPSSSPSRDLLYDNDMDTGIKMNEPVPPSSEDMSARAPASAQAKTVADFDIASLPPIANNSIPPNRQPAMPPAISNNDMPTPVIASIDVESPADDPAGRVIFDNGSADINKNDRTALNDLVARLNDNPSMKIQLRGFADGTPETYDQARRLSLTRALKVRSYLLDKGVSATAMDVRALATGATVADKYNTTAPADRVDILILQ